MRSFLWCMSKTSRDRVNSRRVRTHEKNSGDAVRRLGTIIQSIFCAQSGASIRLTIWKWSDESRYPGAFPPVLENLCRASSRGPTDRPWVSEDGLGKFGERTGQLWRDNSHRVRTHEKNSGETLRRSGTIIQSIFCVQSGTSILLTVWKWSCLLTQPD